MLGASTAAFSLPTALAYARHAARRAPDRMLGRIALGVIGLELLCLLVFAAGTLWNRLG